ncbi:MAG: SLBB domain-containing protein [Sedimentisphaerales bacterium]|nr:SLBB domain-containing protein [Sedimentisphaerales bacterium]
MNLVFHMDSRVAVGKCIVFLTIGLLCISGCSNSKLASTEQLIEFMKAGPIRPKVDVDRMVQARVPTDPYTVVVGDVLELHMPAVVGTVDLISVASLETMQPHLCRISKEGKITLPIVGEVHVTGMDLSEIESTIVDVYYPKYVVDRPSIVARIAKYHTQSVSVIGAVEQPGVYALQSDELSLVALLMKAGGITDDGAGVIRIQNGTKSKITEPLVLPVKRMNMPFADVALKKGDVIEVESLDPKVFTVVGLVNHPGAFPYPPTSKYTLMQALAFAGGANQVASPKYVRVYRQKADGSIIDATFRIRGAGISDASNITVKPGDVVSVEHTVGTDTRLLFAQVFRVTFLLGGQTDFFD